MDKIFRPLCDRITDDLGFVTLVEKRGIIFHTFEGEMVSESQLADTQRVYSRDVYFSIPDDNLARRLQQYQGAVRRSN